MPEARDEVAHEGRVGLPTLRMFAEYGSRTPLWDGRAPGRGVSLDRLGLTPDLRARLRAWCDTFNAEYRWDTGWSSDEVAASFEAEGERLLGEVRAALAGRYVVKANWRMSS